MLVLDFGGQYSQLIARRVREARVYSELVPYTASADEIRRAEPVGADPLRRPGLGLRRGRAPLRPGDLRARRSRRSASVTACSCLRSSSAAGSTSTGAGEFGKAELRRGESALFRDLPAEQTVWMSHRDSVVAPPTGASVTARSPSTPDRRVRGSGPRPLRRPVPRRGRPHPARPGRAEELPLRRRRRLARRGRRPR